MANNPLTAKKTSTRKLFLRATLKIFSTISLLWLAYIFMAGFFNSSDTDKNSQHRFDLSSLTEGKATYFKVNNRELLVIIKHKTTHIFWAQDPVYGCRLEYFKNIIKPVCIDIEYSLNGFNFDKSQQLLIPEFNIGSNNTLIIY